MLQAQQRGRSEGGGIEFGLLVLSLYSKCLFSHSYPNNFLLWFSLSFGRWPHLRYFLQHISSFLNSNTFCFCGGFIFQEISDLGRAWLEGSLALGSNILGYRLKFPFGPMENLTNLFPCNGKFGSANVFAFPLSLLIVHYRFTRSGFELRTFLDEVRYLFFLPF